MKKHLLFMASTFIAINQTTFAQSDPRGTLAELAQHLAATQRVVSVSGESELKVPADRAVITIRLTTESNSLEEA